jgi:hypothetical protein
LTFGDGLGVASVHIGSAGAALGNIYRHLPYYAEPIVQRIILRIIFMVPVSFITLLFAAPPVIFMSR